MTAMPVNDGFLNNCILVFEYMCYDVWEVGPRKAIKFPNKVFRIDIMYTSGL